MRDRERKVRDRLARMDVPQHRPGFWDAVETELAELRSPAERAGDDPAADVVPMGVVPADEVAANTSGVAPWVAASAAAALVLLLGVGTAFLFRPADDPPVVGASSLAPIGDGEGVESLSGSTLPTSGDRLTEAPWAAAPLARGDAPAELVDAWETSENQGWCAALAPASLDPATPDAIIRPAEFPGGWAVAWDRPNGPGQDVDGIDCVDCGRSAFGLAGTAVTPRSETGQRQDDRIEWADGSRADWGGEGLDADAQKRLAEIVVPGQGCVYQVWSNLGDEHLLGLVEELRFVDGLDRGPVALRLPGDPQEVLMRGAPPWEAAPVSSTAVDPLVYEQWEALDVDAPRLVLAATGPELAEATSRTWGQGVAWDSPEGPGHTGSNEPCVDCGRGVVGIGWEPTVEPSPNRVDPPKRIEWSDGSYAEYGSRLADHALPRDRIAFFDPVTGEPTVDALLATVHVAGQEGEVVVWTHLGEAHLLELIDQLRFVAP